MPERVALRLRGIAGASPARVAAKAALWARWRSAAIKGMLCHHRAQKREMLL